MIQLDHQITLEGSSIGSSQTCIWMKHLSLMLDIGQCPESAIRMNTVLLTHAHIDHAGGIAYYISQRKLMHLPQGTIYAPQETASDLMKIISLWEKLEDVSYPYQIIPVIPDREYPVLPKFFFKAYPVEHRIPALGYVLFEEKNKLKTEYLSLSGQEIVELKQQNVEIFHPVQMPRLSYLGDCTFESYFSNPVFRQSDYVMLECTFIDDRRNVSKAKEWGHIHLDEIMGHPEAFVHHKKVILVHFSRRYHKEYIRKTVEQKCPKALLDKILLFI